MTMFGRITTLIESQMPPFEELIKSGMGVVLIISLITFYFYVSTKYIYSISLFRFIILIFLAGIYAAMISLVLSLAFLVFGVMLLRS